MTMNFTGLGHLHGRCEIRLSAKCVRLTNRCVIRLADVLDDVQVFSCVLRRIQWHFRIQIRSKVEALSCCVIGVFLLVFRKISDLRIPFAIDLNVIDDWNANARWLVCFRFRVPPPCHALSFQFIRISHLCNDVLAATMTLSTKSFAMQSSWSWSRSYARRSRIILKSWKL